MPRGLRIAIVTEFYYPHIGGISEHVHFFAREARRRGHHVDVITSNIAGAEPRPHVIRIGESVTVRANGSTARITIGRGLRARMREVLRRGRYDIVHIHTPLAPTLPLLAAREAECPIVGTFHAYHGTKMAYAVGRRYFQGILDRLDAAIAVSTAARDSASRYFDADWQVIPNGVDTELFHPDAAPPALITDAGRPTILFVGRFDPRNGLPVLMDAVRRVRGPRRPVQLVVVGDGALGDRYRRLAGGDRDIIFAGRVPNGLPGYYAGSAIYAAPITLGSFGITLLESMACGTAVACYDTPGFRTLVRHGVEALMSPPHEVAGMADTLAALLDDEALRHRLGQAGRQRSLGFAWPVVADRVLDVYARLLGHASLAA